MIFTEPGGRRAHTVIDSPLGPLTLVADGAALAGVYMTEHRHAPDAAAFGEPDPQPLAAAAGQLGEYLAGERTEFELELAPGGTPFQRMVWRELLSVGYGQTVSYGQLAARISRPSASRAVGLANGRNPLSVVVPCHRVVGAAGSLTGYGGGLGRKRYLLDLEARVSGRALA